MKLIILAAGKGERLMPLTRNTPKSMLLLEDGRTLLETQLDNVIKSGCIDEVVLVLGYRAEQIEAKVKVYEKGAIKLTTIVNPFYDISNNLMSLWFAKEHLKENCLISNGDNIFSSQVFSGLCDQKEDGIFLTMTNLDKFNPDDMKLTLKGDNVVNVSKQITEAEANGESVGLAKICGESFLAVFRETLECLARDPDNRNRFWLEVFNQIAKKAVSIKPYRIERSHWLEFDLHIDLKTALELIGTNKTQVI